MIFKRSLLVAVLSALAPLAACRSIENYEELEEPVYRGQYSDGVSSENGTPIEDGAPFSNGEIKVVTWNIAFADQIEQAIKEFQEFEALQRADIILLQEMDEEGVEAIALALRYDYVYYPASIHSHHEENFGNAVLSKWPISDSEKLILPHRNPKNDQIRVAVKALISVEDVEVPVYSVHTETFWLSESKRGEQLDYLAEAIEPKYNFVIIGGDFNTLTPGSVKALEERMTQAGFERASAGAGPTVEVVGVSATLDHLFVRGFSASEGGVWADTEASDHAPLWVTLTPS
jgi:endonuclease/exonuclease/phosphatase family metal-dependent hydrolase